MTIEPMTLTSCGECGTIYDKYETDGCPNCDHPDISCQDCGGKVLAEVNWGHGVEIVFTCQDCYWEATTEAEVEL